MLSRSSSRAAFRCWSAGLGSASAKVIAAAAGRNSVAHRMSTAAADATRSARLSPRYGLEGAACNRGYRALSCHSTALGKSFLHTPVLLLTDLIGSTLIGSCCSCSCSLVALSPDNGYYTAEVVSALMSFCCFHFKRVVAFIPAESARHNYRALGWHPRRASKRVARNFSRLSGLCLDGLDEANAGRLTIVDWNKHALKQAAYHSSLAYVREMLTSSPTFRQDANAAVLSYLARKAHSNAGAQDHIPPQTTGQMRMPPQTTGQMRVVDMAKAVNEAREYIIEELAWLHAAPSIFKADEANGGMTLALTKPMTAFFENFTNAVYHHSNSTHNPPSMGVLHLSPTPTTSPLVLQHEMGF
jgi:hypothetical protein